MFKYQALFDSLEGPIVISPLSGRMALHELIEAKLVDVDQKLLDHGAILFRGFDVEGVASFNAIVESMSSRHLNYVYRSTPREAVEGKVFTATHYPSALDIPLHNENAYQRTWPLTLAFYCETAASAGGATPLAPMRKVTDTLPTRLLKKFDDFGVEYIRHYHHGVDLPWQTVFQTISKVGVEQYCAENGITHTWLENDLLRTSQICQGVASHPVTRERFFFNQAHLFHVTSLGEAAAKAMVDIFGKNRLPRHARYGNSGEIESSELECIRTAFNQNALSFNWRPGDVLLIDNMQYSHGRQSYRGERKVFAALMNPFDGGNFGSQSNSLGK